MSTSRWAIDIDRHDLENTTVVGGDSGPAQAGDVLLHIDSFALTANNVTYGVFGEPNDLFGGKAGYWDFFAERGAPGRLPVWGFATVTDSAVEGIAPGDRFYGYWPMASDVRLRPGHVSASGFIDETPRRVGMPLTYNQYLRMDGLRDYRPEHHDLWPIFRPLYMTGWLIADQFEDERDYGVDQILIASASGKTALGLGFAIKQRAGLRPRTVGMTSAAHVDTLREFGIYDEVIAYDAIATLDPKVPSALVDMAGNGSVTAAVHTHFGDALTASIVVGKSHWDAAASTEALPGATRQGFFAPGRVDKRAADWGGAELARRMGTSWLGFMEIAPTLATVDRRHGAEGALDAWRALLDGRADPKTGLIIEP